MFGAKIYTVHIDPENPPPTGTPIFVREGFNVFAFVFVAFWALYQRVWLLAFILLVLQAWIMWAASHHVLSPLTAQLLYFTVQVLTGFHANDWRRRQLQKKGYVMADVATGDNLIRAEQRYFERVLAAK